MTAQEQHESGQASTLRRVLSEFQGKALVTMCFRGRVCWTLQSLSIALGHDEKYLSQRLAREWGREFKEGHHLDVLRNQNLKEFRGLLFAVVSETTTNLPGLSPMTRSLTIVYEEGLHKLLTKDESEVGDAIREHLASDVMPQLARTGRYLPAGELAERREELTKLRGENEALRVEVVALRDDVRTIKLLIEARAQGEQPTVGARRAKAQILSKLLRYGEVLTGVTMEETKAMRDPEKRAEAVKRIMSFRGKADIELRRACRHTRRWALLATSRLADVALRASEILERGQDIAGRRESKQLPLKLVPGGGK